MISQTAESRNEQNIWTSDGRKWITPPCSGNMLDESLCLLLSVAFFFFADTFRSAFASFDPDRYTVFIIFPLSLVRFSRLLSGLSFQVFTSSTLSLCICVCVCVTWQMWQCACGTVGPQVAAGLCVCLCVWDSYWCSGVQELFIGASEWWAWRLTQAPHTVNMTHTHTHTGLCQSVCVCKTVWACRPESSKHITGMFGSHQDKHGKQQPTVCECVFA